MSSTSSLHSQRRPLSLIWVRRRAEFRAGPHPFQPPFIFFLCCCSLPSAGGRNHRHSRSYTLTYIHLHLHTPSSKIITHTHFKDSKTLYWGMERMQDEMRWKEKKRTEDRKVLFYPLLSFPFTLFLLLAERAVYSSPITACPPGSRSLNLILCQLFGKLLGIMIHDSWLIGLNQIGYI